MLLRDSTKLLGPIPATIAVESHPLEKVEDFKCMGTILAKYGNIEGEVRERAAKESMFIGSVE